MNTKKPSQSNRLSKEMIENIKNYNDEIVTLESFVAGVRQNIGMWIGSKGNPGFINMIREIVQNSFDELIKKSSPCTTIIVSYDERNHTVIVEDNGRGIPFGNIIRIFEDQNTSSNYVKKKGEYSSGLHGVGAKVTNALSTKFIVESFILGEARRVEFDEGFPWKKGEVKIPNTNNHQGTRITFIPSEEALGNISVTWQEVYNLIKLILPLSKLGAIVHFSSIDSKGKIYKETLVNEDGINTYMYETCKEPLVAPIHIYKDTGELKADIIFTYDTSSIDDRESLISFSNCCPTSSGDHINGFIKGVTQWFTNYMNKVYLANSRTKITVISNDIRVGLKAVISVAALNPVFNGQAKEILAVPELDPFTKIAIKEYLDEYQKINVNDLSKICKYIKDVAEIRLKADKEKIKITNKYKSDPLNGLPSKFVKPTGKKDLELWICEGDSAASTLKNHRDNSRQGYFPIRGKIPNAFNKTKEAFLGNAEVSGIISILDGGVGKNYGKNFDIDKVKYDKIIIGTDADADGYHIASLLMRFFIMYMPGLIESGRVYKSQPPLYGIKISKNRTKYFLFKIDYVKYLQNEFMKSNNVKYINKKSVSNNNLFEILCSNIDYVYEVDRIANRYSIDPILLESILSLKDLSPKKLENQLKKVYRFLKVNIVNKVPVIEGAHNGKYQTIILNDKLIWDCKNILDIMKKNKDLAYILNDKPVSIYELMYEFDKTTPSSVERYKGFGEMSGQKLQESTVNFDTRSLVQYTIEDVQKEFDSIKYFESNKNELIEGVKVSRFDMM